MSERIQNNDGHATMRWKLLTGVSALALTAYAASASANAGDASQPQIWIELGGQLSGLDDGQETFAPHLMENRPAVLSPSQKFEHPPRFSIDGYGALAFQPDNSEWVFSASVKFGRSASRRRVHHQTNPAPFVKYYYTSFPSVGSGHISRRPQKNVQSPIAAQFADTNARTGEHHLILDFQAGRDVGLGLFGNSNGSSLVKAGVRFAQFSSKTNISLKSDPDWHFNYKYFPTFVSYNRPSSKFAFGQIYHSNAAALHASRSFHGIGPSLSWNASAPFAGNRQDGEMSLDWSVNAALLFGRQRTKVHHQTTGRYHDAKYLSHYRKVTYNPPPFDQTRARSVTVPNVGGSLGASYRIENFKVSLGYRADYFFNSIDGGINVRKSEDRAFFGPYASISIGIGD